MKKTLVAAIVAAEILAACAAGANAKVNVDINIGIPGPVYVDPTPVYPGWGGGPIYWANRRISCYEGRMIVRASGFRNINPLNCSGRNYIYSAWGNGRPFYVYVKAGSGRIYKVRPY